MAVGDINASSLLRLENNIVSSMNLATNLMASLDDESADDPMMLFDEEEEEGFAAAEGSGEATAATEESAAADEPTREQFSQLQALLPRLSEDAEASEMEILVEAIRYIDNLRLRLAHKLADNGGGESVERKLLSLVQQHLGLDCETSLLFDMELVEAEDEEDKRL